MAEHLFEHLSDAECSKRVYGMLSVSDTRRVSQNCRPRRKRKDAEYVEEVSPPKDGHQLLFNVDNLIQRLVQVGFQVTPLEYFDAKEEFHCYPLERGRRFHTAVGSI